MPRQGKKVINARAIVTDIRSGSDDLELMSKYALSATQLHSAFRKLLEGGYLTASEVEGRTEVSRVSNSSSQDFRTGATRHQLHNHYQENLNPKQLEAVQTVNGPFLVIAGAGTGKTRTLVHRVAYLVAHGAAPESILLLTFTRRAAAEMISRAKAILDDRCGRVSGGTFHSFANLVLRKEASCLGFSPAFSILDRGDSEDIIGRIRAELIPGDMKRLFPQKSTISKIISKSANTRTSVEEVLTTDYPRFQDFQELVAKVADSYTDYKLRRSLMDYDDLLLNLLIILRDHDKVRRELSDRYKYIMVDEYQDTNRLQADIAGLLAAEHKNIMVVGDDSQSIYSFRGADFRNIISFPKFFPNATLVTLEQNYRSTQPILTLTNAIVGTAKQAFPKELFSELKAGDKPVYLETPTVHDQSVFVCEKILQLREQGVPLNHMAVLFRSSWLSADLEIELANSRIPFVKYGGIRFIEAAHVKDTLAYLRITLNPTDEIAWFRLLRLLEGVGDRTSERIVREIMGSAKHVHGLLSILSVPRKVQNSLSDLHATLLALDSSRSDPAGAVQLALEHYVPIFEQKYYEDSQKRLKDLDALQRIAARYNGIEPFLTDMALEPPNSSQKDVVPSENDEKPLVLSTIHSAKGLEWRAVFLISLVDGYLPTSYSVGTEENVEEERRILYVATTRAKQYLYLIVPHGSTGLPGSALRKPSRFLTEIEDFFSLTEQALRAPSKQE